MIYHSYISFMVFRGVKWVDGAWCVTTVVYLINEDELCWLGDEMKSTSLIEMHYNTHKAISRLYVCVYVYVCVGARARKAAFVICILTSIAFSRQCSTLPVGSSNNILSLCTTKLSFADGHWMHCYSTYCLLWNFYAECNNRIPDGLNS
jgi:hypothetical protein